MCRGECENSLVMCHQIWFYDTVNVGQLVMIFDLWMLIHSQRACSHIRLGWVWFSTHSFKLNHAITESVVRSAFTPPQARQGVGQKLAKLVGLQSFCDDVGCLKIGVDVLKVDIPCKDTFSDEVVVHLNVLCSSMEDGVLSKMCTWCFKHYVVHTCILIK